MESSDHEYFGRTVCRLELFILITDDYKSCCRQCVLASRHTNILQSWPFHEKHLQLCLNQGLKEVLPPFERQASPAESVQGCSNLMQSLDDNVKEADFCKAEVPHLYDDHPQNIKNECDYKVTKQPSSHEEGNQHKCSISSSSNVHKSSPPLPPSKAVKDKRSRCRGRRKKRSIVDILAMARHSTLEEIHGMNKFYYAATVIEGCQQTGAYENISKSELAGEDSCRNAGSEDLVV
ncbi:hypothetical protein JHK87_057447 [Glycine soja]|nr:hypothetical protein JHK87_057447 [Glycine soja]